jgi:hypothetical protein
MAMPAREAGRTVAESRVRDQLLGYLREWEWWGPQLPEREQVRSVIRRAQLAAGGPLAQWQEAMDFALLALKTCAFGFVIAIVGCYQGLAQPLQLQEVSRATTRAVVQSIVACVLLDALFIVVYLLM